ncbi:hypothetical protein LCGC14_0369680 [marine sediment metagenome]|uniref:Uncharacterized protein n=1 Tax=marine sediment metagenome TaxID=412755 RepID=A0A0F9TBB1_9ZZZZ
MVELVVSGRMNEPGVAWLYVDGLMAGSIAQEGFRVTTIRWKYPRLFKVHSKGYPHPVFLYVDRIRKRRTMIPDKLFYDLLNPLIADPATPVGQLEDSIRWTIAFSYREGYRKACEQKKKTLEEA